MGFLQFDVDIDCYKIKKRIDLFPNEKDNYLFSAFFKADKYYLSYISQMVPYMFVLDLKGEILYKMPLGKKWVCAFADYNNRFLIAAGYHSIRLIDSQAIPPEKSPIIAKDHELKCG